VLALAVRAGQAAANATGKEVNFEIKGDATLLNPLPGEHIAAPLLHLVRNAVDHGIEKRGKVTIEIGKRDDLITIIVTDDGRGIAPSILEKIFEPGFSTKDQVSNISGRGVGLDVVKTSIEELGGTVTVRSTPGQGSTFELTLPIRSA
jgi:two-component system chemotaxis sensor kinase CheA